MLRIVTRLSVESSDLNSSEDPKGRVRVSGGQRMAAMSLKGLRFMPRDEFPANTILGNSDGIRRAGRYKWPGSSPSLGCLANSS